MNPSFGNSWCLVLSCLIALGFPGSPCRGEDQPVKKVVKGEAADPVAEKPPAKAVVAPPEAVVQAFAKSDRNGDRQLSLDEFLVDRGPAEPARRDFLIFDQDGDSHLSLDEFWSVPPTVHPEVRGPLPDPMQFLVEHVLVSIDKHIDWTDPPAAKAFTTVFWKRFEKFFKRPADSEADPDGDGFVTRDEAWRFLEIQFGVRRSDGKLLRLPDGRVVNYMLYLHADLNRDDKLDKAEFVDRSYGDANVAKQFDEVNVNKDDGISFDEWCLVPWRGVNDPVMEFRQMDKNLDAFVDSQELMAGTPEWKHGFTKYVFPGFDLNRDGKLSLPEYRMSMPANMVQHWQTVHADADGDRALSFNEFKFESPLFPMLRLMYFQRLDLDSNGSLEPNEWSFTVKSVDEFFVMNEDGTGWKSFFKFEGHPACGSPSVSPNGKLIAFDAWPLKQQGGSALYVMPIEGGEPREVASGMMPNWSGDGKRLACSRSSPAYGVWLLDLEGDNHLHVGPGWGAQVSPDGNRIAYTEGTALKVYDIPTNKFQTIIEGPMNPYQQIFWNAAWSPDGKRLCFKGLRGGSMEVATVNMTGDQPKLTVHLSTKLNVNADFAWHPGGKRVIFSMFCPERNHVQMYEFDPDQKDPPTLVKGQDEHRNNTDMCWTPDGKRLIIISGDY